MTDKDEITDEAVAAQYRQKIDEIEEGVDTVKGDIERRKEFLELREELMGIKNGQREIIQPKFAFENDPEYVETWRKFSELRDDISYRQDEKVVAQLKDKLDRLKQELTNAKEKLDEVENDE